MAVLTKEMVMMAGVGVEIRARRLDNDLAQQTRRGKLVQRVVNGSQGDADTMVPVEGARKWVAKMKELEMEYVYLEVAGGDHVQPAFQKMPDIFAFFNEHQRVAGESGKTDQKVLSGANKGGF